MSFYFTRFVKQVKQTKLRVDMSKQNFNRYLDNLTKSGVDARRMDLKEHPQDIQNNPYFWKYMAGSKLRETLGLKQKMSSNFENPGSRTQPNNVGGSQSLPELVKSNMGALATKAKEFVSSLYNTLVRYFKTASDLDIRKSFSLMIDRMNKSPALKKIYGDIVWVGSSIKALTTTSMKKAKMYVDKYKDNRKNIEAKKYFGQLSRRLQESLENPKHHYIKNSIKRLTDRIYGTRIFFSNSTEKMNTFIKSGFFERKYYILKEQVSNWTNVKNYSYTKVRGQLEKRYNQIKNTNFRDYQERAKELFTTTGIKNFVKGKFYKLLFYFFGIIAVYYSIKHVFQRWRTRSQDKKLEEALSVVRELKTQNETLMKHNEELYSNLNKNY
jgi:hypothetical protein